VLPPPALVAAASLATAAVSFAAWLRARARLRNERLAARLARERQAALLEAVRRLGAAATHSTGAVRAELDRGVRLLAPAIDSVLIFDDDAGQLACTWSAGPRVRYFHDARIARDDASRLPARALERGHRAFLEEGGARGFHPGDAFAVAVPLARSAAAAGVLYAAAPRAVEPAAAEALIALADHAAFAYDLAHERERDRARAEYDALTGLLTPRALRERLAAGCDGARFAPAARVALLFVDTDRFKAWNDAYGHGSGDALLRALAAEMRAAAGPDGVAARNGGDEFCLVLNACAKSQALERAEMLRRAIETLDVRALRPPVADAGVRITASIGVAAYPADAATADTLLERADEAMYHSKRHGRNATSYFAADGTLVCVAAAAEYVS
jgi:diguanylate cyclase (GGDEF)-like protein